MNENKNIKTDNKDILTHCPLCGSERIEAGTCMRCGLVFSKYYEVQARKRQSVRRRRDQNLIAFRGKKHKGSIGVISLIAIVIMLFAFGIVFGTNSLANEEQKAQEISHKILQEKNLNKNLEEGKAYFKKGVRLSNRKDIISASHEFEKALIIFKEYEAEDELLALANLNLAVCYRILKRPHDSLTCLEKTIEISNKNGFDAYKAKALRESSRINDDLGQWDKAFNQMNMALVIDEYLGLKKEAILDCIAIGRIAEPRYPNEAEIYFKRALALSEEINDLSIKIEMSTLLNACLDRVAKKTT